MVILTPEALTFISQNHGSSVGHVGFRGFPEEYGGFRVEITELTVVFILRDLSTYFFKYKLQKYGFN